MIFFWLLVYRSKCIYLNVHGKYCISMCISIWYPGAVIHSHNYRSAEPYAGKSVVLLGAGLSGLDIAMELSQVNAKVGDTEIRDDHTLSSVKQRSPRLKRTSQKTTEECTEKVPLWQGDEDLDAKFLIMIL